MNEFLEYKWIVLVILEALAWLATIFTVVARYKWKSNLLFKVGLWLTLVTGVFPHLTLMTLNIIKTRTIGIFEFVIIGLLIYAFTGGKKHIKKLDLWAQKQFQESH